MGAKEGLLARERSVYVSAHRDLAIGFLFSFLFLFAFSYDLPPFT